MTDSPDIPRLKAAATAIQQLLKQHPGGSKNDEALHEIECLADEALRASEYDVIIFRKSSRYQNLCGDVFAST